MRHKINQRDIMVEKEEKLRIEKAKISEVSNV